MSYNYFIQLLLLSMITIVTSHGDIVIELDSVRAPNGRESVGDDERALELLGDPAGVPWDLQALNVLTHERMAQRPFLKFEDFDFARFIDYGRKFYDNNIGVSGRGKKLR